MVALKQLLSSPVEALKNSSYVAASLKAKTWGISPTGIAADFMTGGPSTADHIFAKIGSISPAPPASPWSGDASVCLVLHHESGAHGASGLATGDFHGAAVSLKIPLGTAMKIRVELLSIWRTKDGKEVNKEVLGSSEWLDDLKAKSVQCGPYTIEWECFVANKA
jgi:hypothetical protein